jgi:hypothetical protein
MREESIRTRLERIATLAERIGQNAPTALPEAQKIVDLVAEIQSTEPSNEDLREVITDCVGTDLNETQVARLASTLLRSFAGRAAGD